LLQRDGARRRADPGGVLTVPTYLPWRVARLCPQGRCNVPNTTDLPPACAELLRILEKRDPEPTPILDVPERLRGDPVAGCARRGLAVRVVRYDDAPTTIEPGRVCVGHGAGWQLARPNDPPERVCVGLTGAGRAALSEQRLAASAANGDGDVLEKLRAAIALKGRGAKPDDVIDEAEVSRQAGRDGLRALEAQGEYAGFAKRRPARYQE
jgi:hypothetical protein